MELPCTPNRDRRKQIAAAGEDFAAKWLAARGHVLVARNWRSGRYAEIDLIFQRRDGILIFVEVKTRRHMPQERGFVDYGFNAIDWRKQRKIDIAARSFLGRNHIGDVGYQYDAALVTYESFSISGDNAVVLQGMRIIHVENAFC